MSFVLPDLPYDYSALEPHIDEETMKIHHGKHHAGYVTKLNEALDGKTDLLSKSIEEILSTIEKIDESIKQAVINNGGGHVNHSFFWEILTPHYKDPEGEIKTALDTTFGSLEKFKDLFSQAALGRFGSGWVWLVKNNQTLEIASTPNQDSPLLEGKKPLLGLDVWEHAYYLKYQNKRADYVNAFWNVVKWSKVNENLKDAG